MPNSLQGFGIAVTRPVDQARRLNAAIEQQGGKAISFPLIAIAPLSDYSEFEQTLDSLEHADWAIFISTNAVDNAMPRVITRYNTLPENLKFAAIGHQTAKELSLYGVHNVLIPHTRFDSETLLALGEMQSVANANILIFRGVGGREVLADTLKARGAHVSFAESYRRVNPQSNCTTIESLWRNGQCHAIVVTSSEAMRHLLQMTNNGTDDWIRNIKICVNHARIAEEAEAAGLCAFVAEAPGDDAMLACLQQALSPATSQS
ncbi:MAG: uroporphyrinogen-III synthase [Pseudomonadota bacterium]